jgi:C4-dicarboxylate-specific signal transduction histidine kinase
MTIRFKLISITIVFSILIVTLGAVGFLAMETLWSVRACVMGEGRWAQAQKNSIYSLLKYTYSHEQEDYQRYLNYLHTPLSDKQARIELQKNIINYTVVEQALVDGENDVYEIRSMVFLFNVLEKESYVARTMEIWSEADERIAELIKVGAELHGKIQNQTLSPQDSARFTQRIEKINSQLTDLENRFSRNLTDASHWMKESIVLFFLFASLSFVFFSWAFVYYISRGFLQSIKVLRKGADRIQKGDLITKIPVDSLDEMGRLTVSFNRMVDGLHKAMAERDEVHLQLTQSSKMASLGEMAGGIAHEINSPLAAIQMWAEHLKEAGENGKADLPLILETTDIIEKTASRITKIVKGLRAFARDGKQDPFISSSLQEILHDTIGFCGEKIRAAGVQLDVAFPQHDVRIDCRSTQISQVLLNLINNAFDAVAGLDEKWIRVELVENLHHVEIIVTDSGKGVPSEFREKIMQPFFTTKETGKGTGLGLSISRGLIESHYGRLTINSDSPNTSFVITLPKVQQNDQNSNAA